MDDFPHIQKADVDAICCTGLAWGAVTPNTIKNCWKRVGLFDDGPTDNVNRLHTQEFHELCQHIRQTCPGV